MQLQLHLELRTTAAESNRETTYQLAGLWHLPHLEARPYLVATTTDTQ
jgi:hypothetical protein